MESWFSTVKSELADRFESCGDAKMALLERPVRSPFQRSLPGSAIGGFTALGLPAATSWWTLCFAIAA
jgi:hypothetical protein